jgi:Pyridoxamine 5'-phosphate oxidase
MLAETVLATQAKGRRAAMTAEEIDQFLGEERTARIASLKPDGAPHVSPIWFVWDGAAMWFYSIVKSQRWTDVMRDPRVAVVVDEGHEFAELHGLEFRGRLEQVGEVPRTGEQDVQDLAAPERLFAIKYGRSADNVMSHDRRHAWLRLRPEKVASWDHRKTVAAPPHGPRSSATPAQALSVPAASARKRAGL